ncbi:MAG: hypothetical protein LBB19_04485, partial [Puniceicoccales bacterium]|nr:hypothetical protein [Puniceicoccales bacterium]
FLLYAFFLKTSYPWLYHYETTSESSCTLHRLPLSQIVYRVTYTCPYLKTMQTRFSFLSNKVSVRFIAKYAT